MDSALLCGGRGYLNEFGICVCGSNYHGENCEFHYCPFGPSWFGLPSQSNLRNVSFSTCSDMGYCNVHTGECICRPGYEGRACERLACPTSNSQYPFVKATTIITMQGNFTKAVPIGTTYAPQCSGHGVCKTLREAATQFDGLNLVNPTIDYENWDADRIQGCLCDYGWSGYDCSLKICPKGRDPADPSTVYAKEEILYLQCQADAGYFSIMLLGKFTDPIPFDADPGFLRRALQMVPNVGKVLISIPASSDRSPQICGSSSPVTSSIRFLNHFGNLPPILVSRNVSATRSSPLAFPLQLSSSSPILRMKTTYTLTCPSCISCSGSIFLSYKTSISTAIDVTASNGTGLISRAIFSLSDLYKTNWPDFHFTVRYSGASNRICNSGSSTTVAIDLFSTIGNIEGLGLIDASFSSGNITLSSNNGNGSVFECSNQGICDHNTGICSCNQLQLDGSYLYRALSSDGSQGLGSRGDCGFLDPPLTTCMISNLDACNGHGRCSNDTKSCSCFQDWYGLTCNLRTCPKGPALFDEPILPNSAHRMEECSGNGFCDRQSGYCKCRPGFSGKACQIRDCPQNDQGVVCSGHGSCSTIAEIYGFFGLSYGSYADSYIGNGKSLWDAFRWNECLCAAAAHLTERRWPTYFPAGPSASISGTYASSEPIAGWTGWDCSKRKCSVGHDSRFGYTSALEVQRVVCSARNVRGSYFRLSLFGEVSDAIYTDFIASEIKSVLEKMSSVGNVTIWFPQAASDNIVTACNATLNSTFGGFYVRFDTEFGDLPLMEAAGPVAQNVDVFESQPGVNSVAECSGSSLGYCGSDGLCSCNKRRFSSNGQDAEGNSGDCSYLSPYARSDDKFAKFSSS